MERLVIDCPLITRKIEEIEYNGHVYPAHGVSRIFFEVLPGKFPVLTIEATGGIPVTKWSIP